MHKKLMMACMAIAAFAAFVIAPAASASPVLTSSTGATVTAGTAMEGKNTGTTLFSGGFNVECSTALLNGTVTANTGTSIKGEVPAGNASFSGTATGGDCTSALGATKATVNSKLCLATNAGADTVKVDGCGSAVTFTLEITGTGPCKYSATSVTGTFVTNAAATVNLNKQPASGESTNGIFCPASGELTMDFDLYTGGNQAKIS